MKHASKLCSGLLILALIFCCIPSRALAITSKNSNSVTSSNSRSIISENAMIYDGSGNSYGYTGWSSLAAAQAYYGYGLSYSSCSRFYAGNYYNYYYTFSDTTKMYFGVIG